MRMLSERVTDSLTRSSWIRRMFETGAKLKRQHGDDAVCDFSLGNPDLAPPPAVGKALAEIAARANQPFVFGYMPNAGYPHVLQALAEYLGKEQGMAMTAGDVILSCGAAGAINCVLRAVLDPCEEVLCIAPFFVDYGNYAQNHGGGLATVRCRANDFGLDVEAIARDLKPQTRVVLINSPNNPSGAIYSRAEIMALAEVLEEHSNRHGRPVYLVSDEPYRFLAYDGVEVPPILSLYRYAIVVSSFSKSLALAGERVGYAALSPEMPGKEQVMQGLIMANRVLGYINAPAIGQQILLAALDSQVDTAVYARRRELMAKVLREAGYDFHLPQGGFYFFPKTPGGDDVAFVQKLQEQLVLAVPGSGFGYPGHMRLAFCVDDEVITRAAKGLTAAAKG